MNVIRTRIERITPAIAEQMLANNNSNRNLRHSKVRSYALLMQAGLWEADSNDAILISEDGELLNGQHRLHAVIEAGIPVDMAVRRGVSRKIFKVLDQGAARSTGDMYIGAVPNKKVVMGAAKRMAALKHGARLTPAVYGKMQDGAGVPNDWIFSEFEEHEDEYLRALKRAEKLYRTLGKGSKAEMIFLILLTKYLGRGHEIEEFIDDVCDKRSITDAAIVLKSTMLQRSAGRKKTTPKEFIGLMLYAYGKYCINAPVQMIKLPDALRAFDEYDELARMKYEQKAGA